LLLFSLPGTLTIYYGEELGMQDVPIRPDEAHDPAERRQPGIGMGRDPERTPMPWDDSPECGFTAGKPWLPIGDANRAANLEWSRKSPGSMFALYQWLLRLRRTEPALVSGQLMDIDCIDGVLQFVRSDGKQRYRVVLNMTGQTRRVVVKPGAIFASTNLQQNGESVREATQFEPAEAMIIGEY
jgi:alpha-glucosidase